MLKTSKIPFNDIEVEKINKIFEELIKDFKLYTKRCEAYNCNFSTEYRLKRENFIKKIKQNLFNLVVIIKM